MDRAGDLGTDGPPPGRRWYNHEILASEDPASRTSVLLVDDNADNLLALSAVLDRLKLRLVQVTSGARALALAEEEEFAAIILDVQMPVLDGFETARLLRMQRRTDRTPIIFLTANSHDPSLSLRGYAEGAVDYLVKPFDPAILRSKVSVFVSLYEARRTVQHQEALLREHALEAQRRESESRYHSLAEAVRLDDLTSLAGERRRLDGVDVPGPCSGGGHCEDARSGADVHDNVVRLDELLEGLDERGRPHTILEHRDVGAR